MPPRADVAAVLDHFGLDLTGTVRPVPESVRNDNYRVVTDRGVVFVRLHEPTRSRERLELNLVAAAHANRAGVPTPPQLVDEAGSALWWTGTRYASIARWVDGRHVPSRSLAVSSTRSRARNSVGRSPVYSSPWPTSNSPLCASWASCVGTCDGPSRSSP